MRGSPRVVPLGPSELTEGGLLSEYLQAHPEAYGNVAPYEGGGGLPYLFKARLPRLHLPRP